MHFFKLMTLKTNQFIYSKNQKKHDIKTEKPDSLLKIRLLCTGIDADI